MPIAEGHERAGVQRYILNDFTGGLHSPGVVTRIGLTDTECACAQDVEFWPVGTVSKRGGRITKNNTSQLSGSIVNIWQWYDTNLVGHVMVFTAASADVCSAQVYEYRSTDDENTWTKVISSGETAWNHSATDVISCATMVGCAFFTNGLTHNCLYAYEGSGASQPACAVTTAPSGAKSVAFFQGYGFLANFEDPDGTRNGSRIRWSDPNDPHTWPASQWLDLDINDGEEITGMCVLGNELMVFKRSKIFAITYVGGDWQFLSELRVNGKGCVSGPSLFPRYTYISFYGADGFYRFDGREVIRYSDKIKDFIALIVGDSAHRISVTASEEFSQLWHLVPLDSSAMNRLLIYDYDRENWTVFRADGMSCMTGYLDTSDRTMGSVTWPYESEPLEWGDLVETSAIKSVITGSEDGWLYYNGTETADASGTNSSVAITGIWQSRWLDFGMPDINKRITRVTLLLDNESYTAAAGYNLHVKMYKDWNMSTVMATASIPLSSTTDVLLEKRIDCSFACRTASIELYTDGEDEPFSLHEVIFEFQPKGRTLVS